ncbi:MAG: hypothetical protein DRR42_10175 [Gammaproteobacteria bacterium]|nr:MAG: hypothetical protein DRR42_10175 [Gammaproteobacteria bacterium]
MTIGLVRKFKQSILTLFQIIWQARLHFCVLPPCRVCGGVTSICSGYGRKFLECECCGLIFTDDYPEIAATRGMGMIGSWGGADVGGEREDFLVRMLAEVVNAEAFLLYGVGSTLAFPVLLSEKFDVCGCDVSSDVIAYRQAEFGSERFFHVNELQSRSKKYDAVIACEVFEHFHDPVKWVGIIVGRLTDGGTVCGTTNFYPGGTIEDNQKVGYMSINQHVAYWSEHSMARLMELFGMTLITFEMVCPGSIKPDLKFNDLFPNKRVFFASSDKNVIKRLQAIKDQSPVLQLDTSDYYHQAYREVR